MGYEHALMSNVTLACQYYLEALLERDNAANRPSARLGFTDRHWVTMRLTVRVLHDDLSLSAFGFIAPFADVDGHARLAVNYRFRDGVVGTLGANLMFGPTDGFFGQFGQSTNIYGRLRYAFWASWAKRSAGRRPATPTSGRRD